VLPSPHIKTEIDPLYVMLCLLVRVPGDGKSPNPVILDGNEASEYLLSSIFSTSFQEKVSWVSSSRAFFSISFISCFHTI
jgi:hypothetical protein